ncbi:MAG: glycosyltransferase family 2 protein, partial [Patescibacteria group bacterium]|nr:glycosyltransferase family 2 protein [Patescibacteria group bacterium]
MSEKKSPKVNMVILNFNGRDLLEKHLPSVVKTAYPNLKTIIVDNNSNDSSVEFIRENYSDIEVIKAVKNLGFGRANNLAFRTWPDCDYYVLLNNDMNVEPDWLAKLVNLAESDPKIGAVGPKILYSQKQGAVYIINSAGMLMDKYLRGFDRYDGEVDESKYTKIGGVKAVSGGAM